MRNISFSLTKDSFSNGSKNVTRRLGWDFLKTGDHLMAVEKAQGLKKGEHITRLGEILIYHISKEPLNDIVKFPRRSSGKSEVEREGFPGWKGKEGEFVKFFCKANQCKPETIVNRIVFRRI